MKHGLTATEQRLVNFLRARQDRGEGSPTYRAMAEGAKMSLSNVHDTIQQLVKKGWVVRGEPKARNSVRLVAATEPVAEIISVLRDTDAGVWIDPAGDLMIATGSPEASRRLRDAIQAIVGSV